MASSGAGGRSGDRPRFAVLSEDPFLPYSRGECLARPWAIPGTRGLQNRIGGLEKSDGTGNISYDSENHARMSELRAAKVAGIVRDVPPIAVDADPGVELLVPGWGSSQDAIRAGVRRAREARHQVACAHIHHLNPLPVNVGDVLRSFPRVLVPEVNSGQLARGLRGRFVVDVESFTKVKGQPLFAAEIKREIEQRA